MTPKEKAKELVKRFNPHVENIRIPLYHAKKCALIAVDEILNLDLQEIYRNNEYWQSVKTEIENL